MNAGIISILLHQLPYQFTGLETISHIFFSFALATFIFFSIIFSLRFCCFGHEAYREVTSSFATLTTCALWPVAWLTLASLTGLVISNTAWVGHRFALVAYTMWWFGAAWNLVMLFWVFTTIIEDH